MSKRAASGPLDDQRSKRVDPPRRAIINLDDDDDDDDDDDAYRLLKSFNAISEFAQKRGFKSKLLERPAAPSVFRVALVGNKGNGKSHLANRIVTRLETTDKNRMISTSHRGQAGVTTIPLFIYANKDAKFYTVSDEKGTVLSTNHETIEAAHRAIYTISQKLRAEYDAARQKLEILVTSFEIDDIAHMREPEQRNARKQLYFDACASARRALDAIENERPRELHVRGPFKSLPEDMVLIDCPGWGDMRTSVFRDLLACVDAIVMVSSRTAEETEMRYLQTHAIEGSALGATGGRSFPLLVFATPGESAAVVQPRAFLEKVNPHSANIVRGMRGFNVDFDKDSYIDTFWTDVRDHALTERERILDFRAQLALKSELGLQLGMYPNLVDKSTAKKLLGVDEIAAATCSDMDEWISAIRKHFMALGPDNDFKDLELPLPEPDPIMLKIAPNEEIKQFIRASLLDNFKHDTIYVHDLKMERLLAVVAMGVRDMLRTQLSVLSEALGMGGAFDGAEELAVIPVPMPDNLPAPQALVTIRGLEPFDRWKAVVKEVMGDYFDTCLRLIQRFLDEYRARLWSLFQMLG